MSGGDRERVDPEQLQGVASGWHIYSAGFGTKPAPLAPEDGWPSQTATNGVHSGVATTNRHFSKRLEDNADKTNTAASDYQQTEEQSSQALKSEAVGAFDLGGAAQLISAFTTPLASALSGIAGPVGSAASGSVSALSSVTSGTLGPLFGALGKGGAGVAPIAPGVAAGLSPGLGAGGGGMAGVGGTEPASGGPLGPSDQPKLAPGGTAGPLSGGAATAAVPQTQSTGSAGGGTAMPMGGGMAPGGHGAGTTAKLATAKKKIVVVNQPPPSRETT